MEAKAKEDNEKKDEGKEPKKDEAGAALKALEDIAKDGLAKGGAEVGGVVPVEAEDLEGWAVGMVKELTPGHQEICYKVQKDGIGVCSKCKWTSGCAACCFIKAVRYWRNQEAKGELGEGYKGRGRGRGRGRGKAKAKAGAGAFKAGGSEQVIEQILFL